MKKEIRIDDGKVRELAEQLERELEKPEDHKGAKDLRARWTDSFRASGGKHAIG